MRVLIGCEEPGVVREEFRKRGHEAWSCDLLPSRIPGPHHQCDIHEPLRHEWDLIIMHPPCTALSVSGNGTYGEGKPKYTERLRACEWTRDLWLRCVRSSPRVGFENPVGVLQRLAGFHKPSYVHPYQFGHLEQKKTGLYLHQLNPLIPANNVYDEMMRLPINERQRLHYLPPSPERARIRSTTYAGIAEAMATQWG